MEYRKNDIVTLKIEDCGIDGEGIGKADGFTVFVTDAVIGDTVRAKIMTAKKNYGYGRLEEIITPSPDRVEPKCQFARQCGGCQLQALSYEKQLEFKAGIVEGMYYDANTIVKIAKIPSREVLLSKLLGSFKSPMASFARVINEVLKSKGGESAAASDAE